MFDPIAGEYCADAPLEVAQIDHAVVDVIVVNEVTQPVSERENRDTAAFANCKKPVTSTQKLAKKNTTRTE